MSHWPCAKNNTRPTTDRAGPKPDHTLLKPHMHPHASVSVMSAHTKRAYLYTKYPTAAALLEAERKGELRTPVTWAKQLIAPNNVLKRLKHELKQKAATLYRCTRRPQPNTSSHPAQPTSSNS